MTINDTSIDLTEDNKFCKRGRLSIALEIDRSLISLISLPWNTRQLTSENALQDTRIRRPWGDAISDEMGYIVRRTSDNKWWFGEYTDYKKSYFWQMFEEVLYETELIKPLYCTCPRCGETQLTTNRFYDMCDKCKFEMECEKTMKRVFPDKKKTKYIPWNDSMPEVAFDENLQRHVVGFYTPAKILQELI